MESGSPWLTIMEALMEEWVEALLLISLKIGGNLSVTLGNLISHSYLFECFFWSNFIFPCKLEATGRTPNAQEIQVFRPKFLQDHWEVCATGKGAIGTQAETQLLHAGGKSEVMNFLSNQK